MRIFIFLVLAWAALAETKIEPKKPVIAVVNGTEITEEDLKIQPQVMQLQKQLYDLKARTLENAISRKIIDVAAAAKHLSSEEFFRQEVDSKIPEPTDAEITGFYWGQKDKFHEPPEKVRDQVVLALKRAKIQEGRQALLAQLRRQAVVKVLIEPPRLAFDVGDAPRKGSAAAPVTVIEFSDYQCPFCKRSQPILQQLAAKYGDNVTFAFKDFPLSHIHPQAEAAAEASRCAGEQGKYWPYHDELFAAAALGPETFQETAGKMGIDKQLFKVCLDSRKYEAKVERDRLEGQSLGVTGTPAFLVNGILLSGAQPIAEFEKLIDSELDRRGVKSTTK